MRTTKHTSKYNNTISTFTASIIAKKTSCSVYFVQATWKHVRWHGAKASSGGQSGAVSGTRRGSGYGNRRTEEDPFAEPSSTQEPIKLGRYAAGMDGAQVVNALNVGTMHARAVSQRSQARNGRPIDSGAPRKGLAGRGQTIAKADQYLLGHWIRAADSRRDSTKDDHFVQTKLAKLSVKLRPALAVMAYPIKSLRVLPMSLHGGRSFEGTPQEEWEYHIPVIFAGDVDFRNVWNNHEPIMIDELYGDDDAFMEYFFGDGVSSVSLLESYTINYNEDIEMLGSATGLFAQCNAHAEAA